MAKMKYTSRQRARIARAFQKARNTMETAFRWGLGPRSVGLCIIHSERSFVAREESLEIIQQSLKGHTEKQWLRNRGVRYITEKKLHEWRITWLDRLIKEFS